MTAGHCTLGFSGPFEVTFDPAGDTNPSAQYINVVAKYTIPSFAYAAKNSNSLQNGNSVPDVALLVLDHAPAGITPADLPSVGLIDTLDFKSALVSVVGYGVNDFANANNPSIGPRYYKDVNITPGQRVQSGGIYLKTEASTCFGDSGGPNFLAGTNTLLGVTSWGQSITCNDHNYMYRIDNTEALNFLNNPTTGVLDVQAHATGLTTAAAATVSSGATPATTGGNELAIGFYADSGFGDTLTAAAGYTSRVNLSPTSDMELLAEDQGTGQGATPAATTGTGPSTYWLMATLVLKSA